MFSDDRIAAIHNAALRVLQELGIRVLLPQARTIYAGGDARVVDDIVYIGRDTVTAALQTAPASIPINAANPARGLTFEQGALIFAAGAGCPNASDAIRGRRPGDLESYVETIKLQQSFDVLHMLVPSAEPQDVAVNLRHYATMQAQLAWSDKPVNVNSRGTAQVQQSFEMIQLALNLGADDFANNVWASTVINTNSPRLLDRPMAQGIIDFAIAGQMSIITPFCLAGAMAPITVAGALTLQHAEALAGITLAQLTNSGAPVSYGGFSSNVDMRSGSPAFGTPEQLKMQIGGGQLARLIGLPWRTGCGTASNSADAQGAAETGNALWGALMANTTMITHSAGWLEGGLTFGYEKFINDLDTLQLVAELCRKPDANEADIGFSALADVAPGGHFFDTDHTMRRYKTAFYPPLVGETVNHGSWRENGAQSSEQRAVAIWRQTLDHYRQPESGAAAADRLAGYIERQTRAGGAAPLE